MTAHRSLHPRPGRLVALTLAALALSGGTAHAAADGKGTCNTTAATADYVHTITVYCSLKNPRTFGRVELSGVTSAVISVKATFSCFEPSSDRIAVSLKKTYWKHPDGFMHAQDLRDVKLFAALFRKHQGVRCDVVYTTQVGCALTGSVWIRGQILRSWRR